MPAPLDAAHSVELAVVDRDGFAESRHLGAAVLVDADGRILDALGDPTALIYPRSAVKPVQATAVLATGHVLQGEQLVLSTASHAGTPRHVAVVERMLSDAGLTGDDLQCPVDWPLDSASRTDATERRRITMNCSGKHAAFLGACVHNGWPTADYLDPAHPMQRAIADTVEEFSGEKVAHWGVDGCHAPTPVISLVGLARSFSRVLTSGSPLLDAIRADPWAIDGVGRDNTVTIEETGILAKLGAEGVLVLGTADGQVVALKTLDGANRARTAVGLEILVRAGLVARDRVDAVLAVVGDPGLRVAF
ncbi:MAG: asparaginase [Pseudolysinimonas sp.]